SQLTFPLRVLGTAIRKFFADDGPFLARGLAFTLLIYCIPLALLTVSAMSYTVVSSQRALSLLHGVLQALIPQFMDDFNTYLSSIISNRGLLGVAGSVMFVFIASTTFGSARLVLNKVFQVAEPRGMIHGKIMEMVMMTATSALFFVLIALVYGLALA